jgi:transcriptional regulator with XRE-family HTH domain
LKDNYNFTLGELVYTVRKINGLTQVEYSKQLGVVQSTISKVEKDIFDDVPFSLVSKISKDFKIPLHYFQLGHLPIRKNAQLSKIIPKEFIQDGVFNAKTIYFLLNEVSQSYGDKIYKELNLPYQLLCLSHITYSFEFINRLYSLTGKHLVKALDKLKLSGESALNASLVKKHFETISAIELLKITNNRSDQLTLQLNFNSHIQELNQLYSRIVELELQLLFQCKVETQMLSQNKFNLLIQQTA